MAADEKHNLGKVVFSHWAGLDGVGRALPLLPVVVAVNFVFQASVFDMDRLEESSLLFFLHFVAFPAAVLSLLGALPRIQFRERGVRRWRWFGGWKTYGIGTETRVTYRFGLPGSESKEGRRFLLLDSGPEDRRPIVLGSARGRDDPRLLEAALLYSRPRAELMLEEIRDGQGVLWTRGVRLDPEGIRGRPVSGGPRTLVPYARIRDYRVPKDRFRLEADDGIRFEGDTFRANFLAGQIALQEMIGSGSV